MKRITCKRCRRVGESVCGRATCASARKPYPPGIHGRGKQKRRREVSEFGRQLFAKQKIRFLYGLSEHQFARIVQKALKRSGGMFRHSGDNPGMIIFRHLETRLDNVLLRLGLASTLPMARALIAHGHVRVDGKKVTRSSFTARPGQTITVLPSTSVASVGEEETKKGPLLMPSWLSRGDDKRSGKIEVWPDAAKEENLRFFDARGIIDYYAR